MSRLEKPYFKHDEGSMHDQKILKLRTKFENAKGYGVFWMFMESMSSSSTGKIDGNALAELELSFGLASSYLKMFVDYCVSIELFKVDENGFIYTDRMIEHIAFRKERSISGQKGGIAKRENAKVAELIAEPELSYQTANSKKRKKSIEEKEKNTHIAKAKQIIDYLNKKTGKAFTYKNMDFIQKRIVGGATVEQCMKVIDNKCVDWLGKADWEKNLNPVTLFRPSHFENYLNEKSSQQELPLILTKEDEKRQEDRLRKAGCIA